MSNDNRFYDVHMHAFNLSHVGFLSFINRFFLNNALTLQDLLRGNLLQIFFQVFTAGLPPFRKARRNWARLLLWLLKTVVILTALGAGVWFWFFALTNILGVYNAETLNFWEWVVFLVLAIVAAILTVLVIILIAVVITSLIKSVQTKGRLSRKISCAVNVLSIFDNDLGRQFRYIELDYMALADPVKKYLGEEQGIIDPDKFHKELKDIWNNKCGGNFIMNNHEYNKVVLVPLMMDFQYKGFANLDKDQVHYNLAPGKPIVDQAVDLFNGIKDYHQFYNFGLLEIYPFMGLNTENYSLGYYCNLNERPEIPSSLIGEKKAYLIKHTNTLVLIKELSEADRDELMGSIKNSQDLGKVKKLIEEINEQNTRDDSRKRRSLVEVLYKYFGDYTGKEEKFKEVHKELFGTGVSKSLKDVRCHFFCGIKVYPPLGFNPWPVPSKENDHFEKVNFLYQFCSERKIPVTTHCGDGGFEVVDRKSELKFTSPTHWKQAIDIYPDLKLDFAHFGHEGKSYKTGWGKWFEEILDLIHSNDSIYADLSYLGKSSENYKNLKKAIVGYINEKYKGESKDEFEKKLYERILFGTDFMVNLFEVESYLQYLETFSNTEAIKDDLKVRFSVKNPARFLFSS